jgi:hypothetical protein
VQTAVPWTPAEVDALLAGAPWPERHPHARLLLQHAIHRWHRGGGSAGLSAAVAAHLAARRGTAVCPLCGVACWPAPAAAGGRVSC